MKMRRPPREVERRGPADHPVVAGPAGATGVVQSIVGPGETAPVGGGKPVGEGLDPDAGGAPIVPQSITGGSGWKSSGSGT
jgi:hypothetical protein